MPMKRVNIGTIEPSGIYKEYGGVDERNSL